MNSTAPSQAVARAGRRNVLAAGALARSRDGHRQPPQVLVGDPRRHPPRVRRARHAAYTSSFVAAVTQRRIGDLTLLDCAASPFLGHRGQSVIGSPPTERHEDVLGFQFVGRGVELVREGERELALRRATWCSGTAGSRPK